MTNLTQNEIAALKVCLNYEDRATQLDDNFSNGGPVQIANALGWNMHQVGGLITNLEKKGVAWLDDRADDMATKGKGIGTKHCDVEMHIVWLTEKGVNAIFDIIEGEAA